MEISGDDLFGLDEEAIDVLPFGLISVDDTGKIEQYNAYESRLSRLTKERVIGRNFFRDVAPCTAVRDFEGRFQAFVAGKADGSETFDFEFAFPFGRQRVNITFLRSVKKPGVKILVNRHDDV